MKLFPFGRGSLVVAVVCSMLVATGAISRAQNAAGGVTRVPMVFSGGHETDPRDGGRPVILIASALGVAADVFRTAFSHVHPAGPGSGGPTDQEARQNKAALMSALAPLGVTDDRLNEVSNYYRYASWRGELWRTKPAVAFALVKDGVVTGFDITDGGSGYSSPPTATIPSMPGVTTKVELSFGKKFETNGAVVSIAVTGGKK